MPKRHQADFGQISNEEKSDFAQALHDILPVIQNYRILTITTSSTLQLAYEPKLHWYLDSSQRLTTQSGFELGSGMTINPSIPEEDANFLSS